MRWDSTSLERAGSSPRGWAAVPKLKVATGPDPVFEGEADGDGAGAGLPVQEVTLRARRTAPVVRTVRRDGLLGTRVSPLGFAGTAGYGPTTSLVDLYKGAGARS